MSEERIKILKMLEEGKITSEEASDLLEAIDDDGGEETKPVEMSKSYLKKYLKIRVYEENDDTKVNINIPIKLVKAGLSFAQSINSGVQGVEISGQQIETILEAIDQELEGEILNIETDGGKTKVVIFIE